jgi:hypothetical protein
MFEPVTGSSGGNRNSTLVSKQYRTPIILAVHAIAGGIVKPRAGKMWPRKQLIATGIAYETLKATTDVEQIAVKAVSEMTNMHPNIMTDAVVA